jgi:GT2 family glycosyltransferase
VHVLVPVYNGAKDFEQLAHSLFRVYPAPSDKLHFVFIDDASPDPAIAQLLSQPMFDRKDVTRLKNAQNLGFIGTVNRGLEAYGLGAQATDIVILNSDTQVHADVFAALQAAANQVPHAASVTPFTNNGTIASLWSWPSGVEELPGVSPGLAAQTLHRLALPTRPINIPTGVGFCMYMTKEALAAVGLLDPAYGKGYGEENHWCQTAEKKGFLNVVTPAAFVYHHGTQSFTSETKRLQAEKNLKTLLSYHPNYNDDVKAHVRLDPLREERTQALWAIRRQQKQQARLHTVLYILHSDPTHSGGGTERHVMALSEHLLQGGASGVGTGVEVMHLFRQGGEGFVLRTFLPHDFSGSPTPFLEQTLSEAELLPLLRVLAGEVDTLHVQHLLGWPAWFVRALSELDHPRKLITLHDYWAACPSVRMLRQGVFCQVPSDLGACNQCLGDEHSYRSLGIEAYRAQTAETLLGFGQVVVPSDAAKAVLDRAFRGVATPPQVRVAPNFLFDLPAGAAPRSGSTPNPRSRVVFLGAFAKEKGSTQFSELAPGLLERGFLVEVWGSLAMPVPEGVTYRAYLGLTELRALAAQYPVDVVVLPFVCAETYSFTTVEAALELNAPVVVGPYGNPAQLVPKHGIGAVSALDPKSLLNATTSCLTERDRFPPRLDAFRRHCQELNVATYTRDLYGALAPREGELPPLKPLPAATRRGQPEKEVSAIVEVPLRYRLADRGNDALKAYLPFIHGFGKWLSRLTGRA